MCKTQKTLKLYALGLAKEGAKPQSLSATLIGSFRFDISDDVGGLGRSGNGAQNKIIDRFVGIFQMQRHEGGRTSL